MLGTADTGTVTETGTVLVEVGVAVIGELCVITARQVIRDAPGPGAMPP